MNSQTDYSRISRGLAKPVTKAVSKAKRKAKAKAIEEIMHLANRHKGPNMSRTTQGTKLCPFPVYNKCDSLEFFPAAFTSLLNSGDFNNFRRLMKTRFDRDCLVSLCDGLLLDVSMFVKCFEYMNELRPDTVMCVHTTKVVGNKICALLYFKFTESKTLRAAVEANYPDKEIVDLCHPPAHNEGKLLPFLDSKSEEERERLAKIAFEADEMVVYAMSYMTLTIDEVSKQVTRFDLDSEFTSFQLPQS